jgi:nucleotide-binding universal stress UspA family protein
MTKGQILIPVDFEPVSRKAIALAKELAPALNAELVLLHVYDLPLYTYPGFDPAPIASYLTDISGAAQVALEQLASSVGVERSILRQGDVTSSVLAVASEIGAKMIVMGTHGRHGLAHALLGSVAERVVRQSPIPVLTIRADEPAKS